MHEPGDTESRQSGRFGRLMAWGALLLSTVGLLLSPVILGFVPAAFGVTFGEMGRRRAARGEDVPRRVCEWAVYLGFAGLVIAAAAIVFVVIWNRVTA